MAGGGGGGGGGRMAGGGGGVERRSLFILLSFWTCGTRQALDKDRGDRDRAASELAQVGNKCNGGAETSGSR